MRKLLRTSGSIIAVLAGMSAAAAFAQDNAKEAPGPGASQGEIVVTGTRRNDLKAADSAQPIDIITGAELLEKGTADMNDLLRTEVPSLNVQRLVSNDGAVFTRPFSLRGLPPDQTLVLVNGKRRHRGATVQFTNVPYIRGSQGPDLSAIPSIAIGQLEVLRDGASALYGSDAIAGVLNFGLRRDREGGLLIARYGQFYKGDGEDFLVQGNVGLPFTDAGFVNISGEYVNASTTSRGIQRPDAQALIDAGVQDVPVPAQRWGNPESEAARIFVNAGIELSDEMEFYTFGNYSWSRGTTAFFYRNPDASFISTSIPLTNTPGGQRFSFRQLFPGGFTPDFGATVTDAALAAGLKGEFSSGLTYDLSASYGQNHASYRIENTVNPSLGLASPTSFKPGQLEQRELAFNLDLTYPIAIGTSDPLTLAGGLEYRRETYEITAGDIASWQVGPFASVIDPDTGNRVGLPVGSNGFPGFSPIQAGEFARSNWAAYTSLEGNLTDALQFGLAGRYENYSDFGSKFTWKINGRYDFSDVFAVRGSVNTGFRAPTPGQSNASQVQTNIDSITGAPLTAGIIAPNNPVAQFFGATPLRPENSFNVAGGIVVKPSNRITFTLDYGPVTPTDVAAVLDGSHPNRLGEIAAQPFFARQQRFTFARCGIVDPLSIADYAAHSGWIGLDIARAAEPQAVVDAVKASGLRGRGGAGFPTGIKWQTVLDAPAGPKYIVCNADEGDSGTFADRMLMEGDPFCLIEGMAIAAHAVGASHGYIYIRSEYPFAIQTMREAIALSAGRIAPFTLEVRAGAGAYVCGEETALLDSIEGKRGQVRAKPPLPALAGLFGKLCRPT